MRLTNISAETMQVKVWKLQAIKSGMSTVSASSLSNFDPDQGVVIGWDPTLVNDFQNNFRIKYMRVFNIETNEACELSDRMPVQKIDQELFNNELENREFWLVALTAPSASAPCRFATGWNMSFVGDVTV